MTMIYISLLQNKAMKILILVFNNISQSLKLQKNYINLWWNSEILYPDKHWQNVDPLFLIKTRLELKIFQHLRLWNLKIIRFMKVNGNWEKSKELFYVNVLI